MRGHAFAFALVLLAACGSNIAPPDAGPDANAASDLRLDGNIGTDGPPDQRSGTVGFDDPCSTSEMCGQPLGEICYGGFCTCDCMYICSCPSSSVCVKKGIHSYCYRRCDGDGNCRAGWSCASPDPNASVWADHRFCDLPPH